MTACLTALAYRSSSVAFGGTYILRLSRVEDFEEVEDDWARRCWLRRRLYLCFFCLWLKVRGERPSACRAALRWSLACFLRARRWWLTNMALVMMWPAYSYMGSRRRVYAIGSGKLMVVWPVPFDWLNVVVKTVSFVVIVLVRVVEVFKLWLLSDKLLLEELREGSSLETKASLLVGWR